MKKKTEKQIIKDNLIILGNKIADYGSANARVAKDIYKKDGTLVKKGGTLRDSHNFRVQAFNVLNVFHRFYGKYQKPNVLMEGVKKYTPEQTKIIAKEIKELIISKR